MTPKRLTVTGSPLPGRELLRRTLALYRLPVFPPSCRVSNTVRHPRVPGQPCRMPQITLHTVRGLHSPFSFTFIILGVFGLGFFTGVLSYKEICFRKIMALEKSTLKDQFLEFQKQCVKFLFSFVFCDCIN